MVALAARMGKVSEGEIVRRLIGGNAPPVETPPTPEPGVPIFADYEGHRVRARYFEPARVEIVDGPLAGQSFKTPTGAARAVVRRYNPSVNDNRNGWSFWQLEGQPGRRVWLQAIRPPSGEV
ncbi:hypothetical protein ACQP2F_27355 [Actinoplanes sp. CA-030573]|uniref:hypothetical protein n=1 Tax=Actinoplanes sp. CA-030573 TaxID=3239898 RepID=UPI003D8F6730